MLKAARDGHSATLARYQYPPAWQIHNVQHIEVWGVKKSRPVFTYRAREQAAVVVVELRTLQFQEIANVLHMYVFNLLAQREGKGHRVARAGNIDHGSDVRAMRTAVREAEATVSAR